LPDPLKTDLRPDPNFKPFGKLFLVHVRFVTTNLKSTRGVALTCEPLFEPVQCRKFVDLFQLTSRRRAWLHKALECKPDCYRVVTSDCITFATRYIELPASGCLDEGSRAKVKTVLVREAAATGRPEAYSRTHGGIAAESGASIAEMSFGTTAESLGVMRQGRVRANLPVVGQDVGRASVGGVESLDGRTLM